MAYNYFMAIFFNADMGLYLLRFAVAIIFLIHGLPKIKKAKAMAVGMGMPSGAVFLLGLVEFLSALGLLVGLYVQVSALLLAIVMAGAIFFKISKWHIPFLAMNTTGWELDWILLASNLAILLTGGGSYSLF